MNSERLASSSAVAPKHAFSARRPCVAPPRRVNLQVRNALSRKKKEEIVEGLVTKLQDSTVVFGVQTKGLSVNQIEKLRTVVREGNGSMYMCKNSLMNLAAERVEGWSNLKEITRGDNTWVFAEEASISSAVKAWLDFEEEQLKDLNAALPKTEQKEKITTLTGGVLQGQLLTDEQVKDLKDLPTMEELITKIGYLIKAIPTKLGVSIKSIPTKVAFSVKAISDLDENKEAIAGDVAKPKPAEE
ncbi:hypothetical protein BSKO_10534 [Bryopsis sp. KO-2023]|nr:hypothetical protein BSKO_10534 [Bryopsis sp. KO-2023]